MTNSPIVGRRLTFHTALVAGSDLGAVILAPEGLDKSGFLSCRGRTGRSDSYALNTTTEQKKRFHQGPKTTNTAFALVSPEDTN